MKGLISLHKAGVELCGLQFKLKYFHINKRWSTANVQSGFQTSMKRTSATSKSTLKAAAGNAAAIAATATLKPTRKLQTLGTLIAIFVLINCLDANIYAKAKVNQHK